MTSGQLDFTPYCPSCEKKLDGFTIATDDRPVDGDLTVCFYCAEVLMVDNNTLRLLEEGDFDAIGAEITMEISRFVCGVKEKNKRSRRVHLDRTLDEWCKE